MILGLSFLFILALNEKEFKVVFTLKSHYTAAPVSSSNMLSRKKKILRTIDEHAKIKNKKKLTLDYYQSPIDSP